MENQNQSPLPLALTVEEAAAALNVSTKTIRRLLARKFLTSSKALRKKLIPREQIEAFLKATCDVPSALPKHHASLIFAAGIFFGCCCLSCA